MNKINLIIVSFLFVLMGCKDQQPVAQGPKFWGPSADDIQVFVNIKENNYKGKSAYLTEITLTNHSDSALKNNWTIYFHQPRTVESQTVTEGFKITHINGDYFKLEPSNKYKNLLSGESVTIGYESSWWALKLVDAPVGLYIVYADSTGESEPQLLNQLSYDPMLNEKQTKRAADDPLIVPNALSRFDQNAKVKFTDREKTLPLIPSPSSFKYLNGEMDLRNVQTISANENLKSEVSFLQSKLKLDFGIETKLVDKDGDIQLSIKANKTNLKGAYKLKIEQNKINIEGVDVQGVFYGIQSLRNLVPVSAYTKKDAKIKNILIEDEPRFEYRGLHLDVCRNFQTKESVLKLLDLMALYKLNKFHFHITDDEGWRLEIKSLPELTAVGSKRGHTKNEFDKLNPAYGSGPFTVNNTPGTGYYSAEDFIEILKFAKERHIEVIPELDFPGHARATIISMKARERRLMAEGKEKEAKMYLLHEPNDASRYKSVQMYDDNVVNVCQESTYKFLERVVDDVLDLYKKAGVELKVVHIGGDEVPHPTKDDPDHGAWMKSPNCKALLGKSEYEKPEDLFYYFVDKFSKILASKGIVTAGWEEIGMKKEWNEEEEEFVPGVNSAFLNRNFIPYVWNTVWGWGAEDRAYKLANAGYKVVLSNVNNLYFDLAYDKDPSDPGYYWGGFVDTKTAWGFIPMDIYKGDLFNNMGAPVNPKDLVNKVRLTPVGAKNILGIQGQLWSETVIGNERMEHYLFPKMLGLVERAWAKNPSWASIENETKRKEAMNVSWGEFAAKIGYFEFPKLSYINGGLNYRIAPPGAKVTDGKLMINHDFPGFELRYTLDGSEPKKDSPLYTEAVEVNAEVKQIKVAAFNVIGRASNVSVIKL
mgnify:CR=1 FL=1